MEGCYASLCFGQWHGPFVSYVNGTGPLTVKIWMCAGEALLLILSLLLTVFSIFHVCLIRRGLTTIEYHEEKKDELGASMTRDPGATSHPSLVKCQFCGSFHGGCHMVMACHLRGRAAKKCRASQGCWIQRAASLLCRSQWKQCNEAMRLQVGSLQDVSPWIWPRGQWQAVWAKEPNMGGFNFADRSISFDFIPTTTYSIIYNYISVITPNSSGALSDLKMP